MNWCGFRAVIVVDEVYSRVLKGFCGRQQIDGSVALWATMEVTSKAIMGIAWEGEGMDDGYRGSKIAALIPDDKNLERNSIDFDP
ncbi:hypothetical protein BHE74_00003741 [Ensete ventricosum]|nr:hypothetical protein BHE74_00003741 [Ensete ventricosum]